MSDVGYYGGFVAATRFDFGIGHDEAEYQKMQLHYNVTASFDEVVKTSLSLSKGQRVTMSTGEELICTHAHGARREVMIETHH